MITNRMRFIRVCSFFTPKKMFLQFFGNLYFPPEKRSSCWRTLSSRKALNWLMSHSTADGPCMANIFNICKKKYLIEVSICKTLYQACEMVLYVNFSNLFRGVNAYLYLIEVPMRPSTIRLKDISTLMKSRPLENDSFKESLLERFGPTVRIPD